MIGIIPARAGFTVLDTCWVGTPMDHPRSRGVYARLKTAVSKSDGSSPLARGLPGEKSCGGRWAGIIPARAGFTWTLAAVVGETPGSSPLARGLRE